MMNTDKVWVEAERERSGDGSRAILSLKDVWRRRQIAQENNGVHSAKLPMSRLGQLGFPEQLLVDLERGRPVRFRMNESAFRTLVHQSGSGLNGLSGRSEEDEASDEELMESAVIADAPPLGSRTSASFAGKHIGVFDSEDEAIEALQQHAEKANYYPNLYYIDDHGGINPRPWPPADGLPGSRVRLVAKGDFWLGRASHWAIEYDEKGPWLKNGRRVNLWAVNLMEYGNKNAKIMDYRWDEPHRDAPQHPERDQAVAHLGLKWGGR